MKITRKAKVLGATALAGGALAYLMDPLLGRRRRERLAAKVERRSADVRHVAASVERIKNATLGRKSARTGDSSRSGGVQADAGADPRDPSARRHMQAV